MGKLPASLFYWGDFVRDPNVRRCTHAEVGVWMRLLCLMFDADTKGVLETNGVPWTDEEICMAIGGRYEETLQCVTALVTKGVASRSERGALMNRRMYREEKERVDTRERVRKHREKQASEQSGNAECNGVRNANGMPCTETEYVTEPEVTSPVLLKKPIEANLEEIYSAYPRKVGRAGAFKAIARAFERLRGGECGRNLEPDAANELLLKAARAFARAPAGQAGEYTPHPATWFNNSRYLDDPNEWQRGNNANKPSKAEQIRESSIGALAILERMDSAENCGFDDGQTRRTDRRLLEGPHSPPVA